MGTRPPPPHTHIIHTHTTPRWRLSLFLPTMSRLQGAIEHYDLTMMSSFVANKHTQRNPHESTFQSRETNFRHFDLNFEKRMSTQREHGFRNSGTNHSPAFFENLSQYARNTNEEANSNDVVSMFRTYWNKSGQSRQTSCERCVYFQFVRNSRYVRNQTFQ